MLSDLSVHKESIKWLETLLRERLNDSIVLSLNAQGDYRLSLLGRPSCITILKSNSCFLSKSADVCCGKWLPEKEGFSSLIDYYIPSPGWLGETPLISAGEGNIEIQYDILGMFYWVLTRAEEVGSKDVDSYNRFSVFASHAYLNNYLDRPVVDEWMDVLGQVIKKKWADVQLNTFNYSMRISHDVDTPSLFAFKSFKIISKLFVFYLFKKISVRYAFFSFYVWFFSKNKISDLDPVNTFDWLMRVSEKYDLKSAFYFICGVTDKERDADYEFSDPRIKKIFHDIYIRGHELGLHPSFNCYKNHDALLSEFKILKNICEAEGITQKKWGGRMHYLRWSQPETLAILNDVGLNYDSTLGYADVPGFRCGTCFEYPAFDPCALSILKLRIRPLIVMECSVISDKYMGLGTGDSALNQFIKLKDRCKKVNGCFTLLWHNSSLSTKNERLLYEKIISSCI